MRIGSSDVCCLPVAGVVLGVCVVGALWGGAGYRLVVVVNVVGDVLRPKGVEGGKGGGEVEGGGCLDENGVCPRGEVPKGRVSRSDPNQM